jgi:glycosyltransferase 2 family protein
MYSHTASRRGSGLNRVAKYSSVDSRRSDAFSAAVMICLLCRHQCRQIVVDHSVQPAQMGLRRGRTVAFLGMTAINTASATTRRRAMLGMALGVPVSIFFLVLAIRGTDVGAAWDILGDATLGWMLVALCGLAVFLVAGGARWCVLLRPVRHTTVPVGTAAVIAAAALSNSIPGRPGDVARVWWATKTSRKPAGRVASTVVLDRVADVIVLTGALAVAASKSPPRRGLTAILVGATILSLLVVGLVVAAFLYVHSERGRAREASDVTRSRLRGVVSTFLRGLADLTLKGALLAFLLTLLAWCGFGLTAWATGKAIGLDLSALSVVMLTAVINLGIAIPSSPGFVGTYQWLAIATLEPYGFARTTAFAYSVLLHAISLIPPTLAGYGILAVAFRRGTFKTIATRANISNEVA